MTPTRISAALILAAALALPALPARAHALLEKASPAAEGTVAASPGEIRLTFSEGIEPKFSGAQLAGAAGAAIPLGKPALDPGDAKTLVIPVGGVLAPGVYKVSWHVVSVDTHKSHGAFSFTVGR